MRAPRVVQLAEKVLWGLFCEQHGSVWHGTRKDVGRCGLGLAILKHNRVSRCRASRCSVYRVVEMQDCLA